MAPSTISVTFIDDASSTTIAALELPIANLPETFDRESTVRLGDDDWAVVSARPRTKPEFGGSGKLVLHLRRLEQVNPSDLLYSLPSICDRLPTVSDTPPGMVISLCTRMTGGSSSSFLGFSRLTRTPRSPQFVQFTRMKAMASAGRRSTSASGLTRRLFRRSAGRTSTVLSATPRFAGSASPAPWSSPATHFRPEISNATASRRMARSACSGSPVWPPERKSSTRWPVSPRSSTLS